MPKHVDDLSNGAVMSGAVIIMRQNKIMCAYRSAGATSPERARMPQELGVRESRLFRRMAYRGVFVPTEPGRYYIDEAAAERFVVVRRQRVLTITVALLLAFLVYLFLMS